MTKPDPRPNRQARAGWSTIASLCAVAAIAGCGGGGGSKEVVNAESACKQFLGETFEGAKVTEARFVAAAQNAPEHCIVRGEMPEDLDFEVRMPTAWNQRTVFMGGGGFDGLITPADRNGGSPVLVPNGYATIATNHGHSATTFPGGSFALNPQMLLDYANQSVPRVTLAAKAVLQARYGEGFLQTKMVYEGCSGGGRQALMQAQRHPELFNGIVSRAPANAFNPQFLWYQKVFKTLSQPGGALSDGKIKAITNAVYSKCDALDGLKDRIVSKPETCQFDPAELRCTGAETDACLTDPQIQSARAFYAPTDIASGRYKWPGFPAGGEDGGAPNLASETQKWGGAGGKLLMGDYIKYMVAQDAAVDPLLLDPLQYTGRIDQLVGLIDAVNPDLSRFKGRGGKLILWHGSTDWLITVNNSTDYYQQVVSRSGGQAAADTFMEYFVAPGVGHCAGGEGADRVDLVSPMFNWLEGGPAPSKANIVATQNFPYPGEQPKQRPLCKYPQYAKYVGGDTSTASSFSCVSP